MTKYKQKIGMRIHDISIPNIYSQNKQPIFIPEGTGCVNRSGFEPEPTKSPYLIQVRCVKLGATEISLSVSPYCLQRLPIPPPVHLFFT